MCISSTTKCYPTQMMSRSALMYQSDSSISLPNQDSLTTRKELTEALRLATLTSIIAILHPHSTTHKSPHLFACIHRASSKIIDTNLNSLWKSKVAFSSFFTQSHTSNSKVKIDLSTSVMIRDSKYLWHNLSEKVRQVMGLLWGPLRYL